MKRYIVGDDALKYLPIKTVDGAAQLAKSIVITDEDQLHFPGLSHLSVCLSDDQVNLLESNNLEVREAAQGKPTLLVNPSYEKERSEWKKFGLKNITGRNVKVCVADNGCNTTFIPCDYAVNLATGAPGVGGFSHGGEVMSVIKSEIGLAPGCENHFLRIFDDNGLIQESSLMAMCSYCITNHIDILNMSWQFTVPAFQSYLNGVIASGCIPVAASGNSDTMAHVALPAGLDGVVAVNGVKEDGTPAFLSVIPNGAGHGISVACAGYGNEVFLEGSGYIPNYGTSFAAPFFCGLFACYKEELGMIDNKKVVQHMLNKAIKQSNSLAFGAGILSS